MAAILADPMIFYLAKGGPDVCGAGCSEWIAAEGGIDPGAAQRLRALLNRLGKRKLPIFFHSPGGVGGTAMEIGRILREREMTAGVSRTIPLGCADASAESCRSMKRSGQMLSAELHSLAGCNSGCVYALVGAKVRQVPPGAKLGVHSAKLVHLHRDGRSLAAAQGDSAAYDKSRVAELNGQIRRYLQTMQINAGLFEAASRTPYEQIYNLSRDEIAAFGIDTREFQETPWMAVEQPSRPSSVVKLIVEAKGPNRKEFRVSMVRLSCLAAGSVAITYARGLGSGEIAATRAIKLAIPGRVLSFPQKPFIAKIDAIDTGGSFDARSMHGLLDFFEAAATRDGIDVVESDPAPSTALPRITKLSTAGLANKLAGLRKSCGAAPALVGAPAGPFLDAPGAGAK
jgi:hypothetical protein